MHRPRQRVLIFVTAIFALTLLLAAWPASRQFAAQTWRGLRGNFSIEHRLRQYCPAVETRLRDPLEIAGLNFPPHEMTLIAFKDAKRLEVYARMASADAWVFVKEYPILACSGRLGPKLKEGDRQVPEGIYAAESLNPNSRHHLSIRLNYPNEFDRQMADADKRKQLGSDIMIHGGSSSIGCLAMGDRAAEDLFVLSALVGIEHVQILICPTDLRVKSSTTLPRSPPWVDTLYSNLRQELHQFPENAPLMAR